MAKNRTIYVTDKDAPVWDEAKRLIPFHERKSLSAYLTEHLREYVKKRQLRPAKNKD